ncbi:hypothetical protein TSOC_011354 [Tetrabaena socialis]|uniref:Uncharacterized protein n=1 Tax=Tetrabaena socialis TaxID=47790 RepID=A0A2J7ZQV8_9CHLO|nr:hypothetical protein TSOC_011354 [Tetrabaena socialis]|eukprot:PNH02654.1 hypothetical protein TSOC_011354 [Tetrabaena socialis]
MGATSIRYATADGLFDEGWLDDGADEDGGTDGGEAGLAGPATYPQCTKLLSSGPITSASTATSARCAEKIAFMTGMYCMGASGEPSRHSTRGRGARPARAAAAAAAAAEEAAAGAPRLEGFCCWRRSLPADVPPLGRCTCCHAIDRAEG